MEIERIKELGILKTRFDHAPVAAILGPRQCGKTTLAHQYARMRRPPEVHFFDMENPVDLARIDNPMLALKNLRGLVVIDQIQRRPNLFPVLRVLADQNLPVHFLILGSASRDLIHQGSETLAGRISFVEMGGFSMDTLSAESLNRLWLRGGFPRSFLAKSHQASFQIRQDFISTFLERDIPNFGIGIPAKALRRFWLMVAHYHAQIFEAAELARSLVISIPTVQRYLDILCGTFMMRQIQPWRYNTNKRLIKRPKIYFRDSGLYHALLSVVSEKDLQTNPKLGSSWEGFALEQVIEHLNLPEEECFFWGVHTGAELDLLFRRNGKFWGVEVKYNEAPGCTKSMLSAVQELSLAHLWVFYPGQKTYSLHKKITAIPIADLRTLNSWTL